MYIFPLLPLMPTPQQAFTAPLPLCAATATMWEEDVAKLSNYSETTKKYKEKMQRNKQGLERLRNKQSQSNSFCGTIKKPLYPLFV